MRPLTPDHRQIARMIATGQILLCAPGAVLPRDAEPVILLREPIPDSYTLTNCDTTAFHKMIPETEFQREREPWRRGRPLR